ncbi:DNA glycosylase AlkZ-like family protein [Actinomyces stomatis]|uniref:DNA glycosylase AlkZ-like family protein n=1 Tax=Actinomyces stomatis TaxID=3050227 RepID=UPI00285296D9|nr:crosslink repair DNA glycosylase YcaQ family protein [Actinomyces sp. PK606]
MPAARASSATLPTEVSLARIISQGLIPATAAPDVVAAVSRQLAIQGQQVSAVPHALLVRAPDVTPADVDAAFARGDLVRSWPMRGTVHITTAADHHWLRAVLMHRTDAWVRRSEADYGVDTALCERAAEVALDLIGDQGPLTRAVLLAAWQEAGLMEAFRGEDVSSYRRRHLLVRLQREGILVQGPRAGNEHLVVDARTLPDADSGPAGADVTHGGAGHRAACAHIAYCYAAGHGPVSAEDLARWTTLPKTQAARALEDAVELGEEHVSAEGAGDPDEHRVPLVRAVAEGGARGSLRPLGPGESAPKAGLLYMRADLPDLLSAHRGAAQATHFLGSFDELHVGYKDRSCLTDEDGERLICPASNGMFRPILVDRGRLVAVRPVGEGLLWKGGEAPSARVERDVNRAVSHMERRLAG